MQDKATVTQAKCAEWVKRLHKKTSCTLSLKKCNTDNFDAKEVRVNIVIKRKYLCCESWLGEIQVTTRWKHDKKCVNRTRNLNTNTTVWETNTTRSTLRQQSKLFVLSESIPINYQAKPGQ